ncbi:hypothetical protein [Microlunatus ginsengisoli]|uniref:Asp23/Gls24 family envelope stress response protein n=1 Tax=Microlunatus ginsengisoli TaxID=363863 RepID=A0ABP7A413_9ACTN
MAVRNPSQQLGCGRDMDDVWASLDRPPDGHELGCPECRAARASLVELAEATAQLGRSDDADLQAGPQVVDRILDIARSEVRRGRRLPLVEPVGDEPSSLSVAEQAVATIVRRVGDLTPGVQVRRCTVGPVLEPQALDITEPDPPVDDGRPAALTIGLGVSVDGRRQIPGLIEALRRAVIAAVEDEVGVRVPRVDVVVEDVHDV